MPVLLLRTGESNKFIKEDSERVLSAMTDSITSSKAVSALVTFGARYVYMAPSLSVYMVPSLSVYMAASLSVYMAPSLSVYMAPSLSVYMAASLSVYMAPSLSVCLSSSLDSDW